jgi:hypothetical protein
MRAVVCGRSRSLGGHRGGGAHGSPPGQAAGTGPEDLGVPAAAGGPGSGVRGLDGFGRIRVAPQMPKAHDVPRIGRGRGYRVRREAGR